MKRSIRRRRLEAKTDYKARLELLKSRKPRIVIRKTNRYIIVQVVTSELAQDRVVFGASSKVLLGREWPEAQAGSLKSLPASYLTGFFVGKQIKEKISEAIIDLGMHRNIQKSRIYAVVKGIVDSGMKIPYGKEALPTEEEIMRNTKLREIFQKVKAKI